MYGRFLFYALTFRIVAEELRRLQTTRLWPFPTDFRYQTAYHEGAVQVCARGRIPLLHPPG